MPNQLPLALDALLQWWNAEGVGIETRCVSSSEIELFESRCAIDLPTSFRDYLSRGSPVRDPSWDKELTNWWPFERLRTVSEGYEYKLAGSLAAYRDKLVLFADYSMWCWAWAINCAPGADYGKVAVIAGKDHDRFVAECFDRFINMYVDDDPTVLP